MIFSAYSFVLGAIFGGAAGIAGVALGAWWLITIADHLSTPDVHAEPHGDVPSRWPHSISNPKEYNS